ncbi:hypothetical protein TRVL_09988 [Trypanosoma vivax]|nr:hypothetical protein TRVL_09988 [Trypanosoma vivax]
MKEGGVKGARWVAQTHLRQRGSCAARQDDTPLARPVQDQETTENGEKRRRRASVSLRRHVSTRRLGAGQWTPRPTKPLSAPPSASRERRGNRHQCGEAATEHAWPRILGN